jgi:hypothetical protein
MFRIPPQVRTGAVKKSIQFVRRQQMRRCARFRTRSQTCLPRTEWTISDRRREMERTTHGTNAGMANGPILWERAPEGANSLLHALHHTSWCLKMTTRADCQTRRLLGATKPLPASYNGLEQRAPSYRFTP